MNIEDFRRYCLSLPEVKEKFPWTQPRYQNLMTFTVADKWFCILDLDNKDCNLKCPPDEVFELQAKYEGIQPGWHMNKKHWISLLLESDVPLEKIKELVRQSYALIIASLTKTKRKELSHLLTGSSE